MRPHRLAIVVAALAVLTAAVAACGERSPRAKTADAIRALGPELTQLREDVEFELVHTRLRSRRELTDTFGELTRRADDQLAALAAADPPSSLRSLVATLRDAVERERGLLARTALAAPLAGARAPDALRPRIRAASARVLTAWQRLERALQAGGT